MVPPVKSCAPFEDTGDTWVHPGFGGFCLGWFYSLGNSREVLSFLLSHVLSRAAGLFWDSGDNVIFPKFLVPECGPVLGAPLSLQSLRVIFSAVPAFPAAPAVCH